MVDFMSRLTRLMQEKNIKAAELSRRTGISKPRMSQYVNGVYIPKADAICAIANALGVSESFLLGNTEDVTMQKRGSSSFKTTVRTSPRHLRRKSCGFGLCVITQRILPKKTEAISVSAGRGRACRKLPSSPRRTGRARGRATSRRRASRPGGASARPCRPSGISRA